MQIIGANMYGYDDIGILTKTYLKQAQAREKGEQTQGHVWQVSNQVSVTTKSCRENNTIKWPPLQTLPYFIVRMLYSSKSMHSQE